MEFDVRLRLFARSFVDAQVLELNRGEKEELVRKLGVDGLVVLPVAVRSGVETLDRPGFANEARQMRIVIGPESVDFLIDGPDDPITFVEFASLSTQVLGTICAFIGRVPHRLALVQEGLLPEMPTDQLDAVCTKVLRPEGALASPLPFEWDWRSASRHTLQVGGRDEATNEVVIIRRFAGIIKKPEMPPVSFDRVLVSLDVNTAPTVTRGRFDTERLEQFFTAAVSRHAELATATLGRIRGELS